MGSNDTLAGVVAGVGENSVVRSSESRSDRSKSKKPLRGAPPSSLSHPITSDRSRSLSPSKTNRAPSLPNSRNPSPSKIPLILPSTTTRTSSTPRSSIVRGRPQGKGRTVAFKHHQFLPRATDTITPPQSSFQPHYSTIESQPSSSSYRAFEFKTSAPVSPTTNVSVSGEILPSPSLTQQINTSSLPITIESRAFGSSSQDIANMSSITETTPSIRTFRPGSEGGYDNSPMARLMRQYREDSNDDDTSTWQRTNTLSSKKSLLPNEIVERRGLQQTYALHPTLLEEVTRVVSELQIFLQRTSAMIPERTSYFKVDPRDTFMSILKESSDISQIHAAWMGLSRRLVLAQENLAKYQIQYRGPIEGEESESPMSPISTDIGIYEAIEGEEDKDFRMRYIYENVPHHQDQIRSPRKLRDGTAWGSIISLPSNMQDSTSNTLPTIPEQEYTMDDTEAVTVSREKGKRRITDEFASPPTSPRIVNIGYGTPFKSSSQFFVRPGIPLPPPGTLSQKNVLVGLALPQTPAFEDISNSNASINSLPFHPSKSHM